MNRALHTTFFILSFIPSLVFAQAVCYPVANASFEQSINNKPLNWLASSWGGSQADFQPSAPGPDSGYAGQIDMQPFVEDTDAKLRSDDVAVPANTALTISLFARGTATVVELQVVQFDSQRRAIDHTWLGSMRLAADALQWQEYAYQFYSMASTSFIQIEIVVKSDGVVYFDNVSVGSGQQGDSCAKQSTEFDSGVVDITGGVIFSRTDTNEYRWVAPHRHSGIGSVWIAESCAQQLDAPVVRGDWVDLISLAPRFDSIKSPCATTSANTATGYVFARTDISEYRWIDLDFSGVYGSRWISQACAMQMGGPVLHGDWAQLMTAAPAFDGVPAPCR